MKIVEIELPKKVDLYLIGDTHYPRGKREIFQGVLKEVEKNKHALMVGFGDWVEAITAGDPRYNPEEMAGRV